MNLSPLKIKTVNFAKNLLGEKRTRQILNKKYIGNYQKQKIVFIHIPKAAGTSIAGLLYGKRNGHLKAEYVQKELGKTFADKFSFSVSRNPYDRLVSAYNFARQGETKHGAIAHPEFYQSAVFDTFESFVKSWLVKQDLNTLDPVFQPQHLFVFKEGNCLVDELFKVEEMGRLEDKLSDLLNKEVHFKKKNQSTYKEEINYIPELKELVYQLYQKDFELFNYSK